MSTGSFFMISAVDRRQSIPSRQQSEVFALKKRNKKNKGFLLGLCALIVAVAMVSVSVTLATGKPNFETNVVVIGNVKIDLIDEYYEKQPDFNPDDPEGTGKHYTKENPPVLNPKTTVNKNISVKNIGEFPCYVRLLIKREWKVGTQNYSGLIQLNIDETNWYKGSNVGDYECYYYKNILPAKAGENSVAPSLCKTFYLGDFDPDEVAGTTGDIHVYAQAVQSDNVDIQQLTNDSAASIAASTGTIVKNSSGMIVKWDSNLVFD